MHLQAFKICVFIYLFFNTNDSILYTSVLKLDFFFFIYIMEIVPDSSSGDSLIHSSLYTVVV